MRKHAISTQGRMCASDSGSFPVERFGEFPPTNAGKEMASPSPTLFSFPRTLLPNVYVCVCVRALKTEPPSLRNQPLNTEKGGKGGSAKSREKGGRNPPFSSSPWFPIRAKQAHFPLRKAIIRDRFFIETVYGTALFLFGYICMLARWCPLAVPEMTIP